MEDLIILHDLDQVKALTDPLRMQILEAFSDEPQTVKQAAQQLGEKPTRLYHHVAILEQAGLIQVTETRQNRGTIEKYYQVVARNFQIDRKLLEFVETDSENSDVCTFIHNALEDTLVQFQGETTRTLLKTSPTSENLAFVRAQGLCLTPEQIANLRAKINGWLEECQQACAVNAHPTPNITYALTMLLYPQETSPTHPE